MSVEAIMYFNTSHVSINHISKNPIQNLFCNFNTSHVSINLVYSDTDSIHMLFQYISCFY